MDSHKIYSLFGAELYAKSGTRTKGSFVVSEIDKLYNAPAMEAALRSGNRGRTMEVVNMHHVAQACEIDLNLSTMERCLASLVRPVNIEADILNDLERSTHCFVNQRLLTDAGAVLLVATASLDALQCPRKAGDTAEERAALSGLALKACDEVAAARKRAVVFYYGTGPAGSPMLVRKEKEVRAKLVGFLSGSPRLGPLGAPSRRIADAASVWKLRTVFQVCGLDSLSEAPGLLAVLEKGISLGCEVINIEGLRLANDADTVLFDLQSCLDTCLQKLQKTRVLKGIALLDNVEAITRRFVEQGILNGSEAVQSIISSIADAVRSARTTANRVSTLELIKKAHGIVAAARARPILLNFSAGTAPVPVRNVADILSVVVDGHDHPNDANSWRLRVVFKVCGLDRLEQVPFVMARLNNMVELGCKIINYETLNKAHALYKLVVMAETLLVALLRENPTPSAATLQSLQAHGQEMLRVTNKERDALLQHKVQDVLSIADHLLTFVSSLRSTPPPDPLYLSHVVGNALMVVDFIKKDTV